ncbi:MAG: CoA transferase [Myxococcales bacterium]|nr:CoA transferase [Myxococcales bacterium]
MSRLPALDGTTVLDFATVGPAARCSRILADYGATVVKIGAPPSKAGVQIEPVFHAYSAGRGMRQARIDLKAPAGKAAFFELAKSADVVLESYRPGVVRRLGIAYEDVRAVNPRIVYCSTSGYGQDGPASQWAGHDLNYLAVGGFLACSTPREDGGPPIPGATVADSAAGGMHAVIAILAALLRRGQTGEGEYLDVSVADGVLQLMALTIDEHLATGTAPGPRHDVLTGRYAFYDNYATRDGRWLSVAAIEPRFWANLCRALDLERWASHQYDDAVQDEIRADLRAAFAQKTRDAWAAELGPADTCVAPVRDVAELADDPQYTARGAFSQAVHPEHGTFRQVAPVLAGMERAEGSVAVRGGSGSDTAELLRGAGMPAPEIEKLLNEGVVA